MTESITMKVSELPEIPSMPENWWPDGGIIVVAKHGGDELAFAITEENFFSTGYEQQISSNLKGLRHALWLNELEVQHQKMSKFIDDISKVRVQSNY
jgi:hypothetical protein